MLENPEFIAAVIAVLTGLGSLLTAITLYVKNRADVSAIRDERSATKVKRDDDSQQMHDDILKLQFQSIQNRDNIGLLFTQVKDSNEQITLLSTQLAQMLVKMDNVISTLQEMKEDFKNG